jgi:uncharacterized coiled-coil DUF342 family protein
MSEILIPSIIIPSSDNFEIQNVQNKRIQSRYNKGNIVENDFSTWALSLYDFLGNEEIYEDINERIMNLRSDIKEFEYHRDFSQKTRDNLEAEKRRIIEGVTYLDKVKCSHRSRDLVPQLETLLKEYKEYFEKYMSFKVLSTMSEDLYVGIRKLIFLIERVDIDNISYEETVENLWDFYRERYNFSKSIKKLKKMGLDKKGTKRFKNLISELDNEIDRYRIFFGI